MSRTESKTTKTYLKCDPCKKLEDGALSRVVLTLSAKVLGRRELQVENRGPSAPLRMTSYMELSMTICMQRR
jgi:hypothetical protein